MAGLCSPGVGIKHSATLFLIDLSDEVKQLYCKNDQYPDESFNSRLPYTRDCKRRD